MQVHTWWHTLIDPDKYAVTKNCFVLAVSARTTRAFSSNNPIPKLTE